MAVKKNWMWFSKDPCPKCNGTGAKPGTSPETCPKCGGKGQVVYTQQSFFGTVQNVQTCPDCHGTGKIIREKCPDCGGTGYISSRKKISVTIPAGIDNGQSVRIREKGEPGRKRRPQRRPAGRSGCLQASDLPETGYAHLLYGAHFLCGRRLWEPISGSRQWTERFSITVKPGTKTDTKVRLKGKGVPSVRNAQVRGRSLRDSGDPDTGTLKSGGKRSPSPFSTNCQAAHWELPVKRQKSQKAGKRKKASWIK